MIAGCRQICCRSRRPLRSKRTRPLLGKAGGRILWRQVASAQVGEWPITRNEPRRPAAIKLLAAWRDVRPAFGNVLPPPSDIRGRWFCCPRTDRQHRVTRYRFASASRARSARLIIYAARRPRCGRKREGRHRCRPPPLAAVTSPSSALVDLIAGQRPEDVLASRFRQDLPGHALAGEEETVGIEVERVTVEGIRVAD